MTEPQCPICGMSDRIPNACAAGIGHDLSMTSDGLTVRFVGTHHRYPAVVTFSDFAAEDAYIARYRVTVSAEGLHAVTTVTDSVEGRLLPDFLDQLSNDFRGWKGARTWHALEDQLRVTATWHSRGHIELAFEIRPDTCTPWSVTAETELEAGEETRRAASDLRELLNPS